MALTTPSDETIDGIGHKHVRRVRQTKPESQDTYISASSEVKVNKLFSALPLPSPQLAGRKINKNNISVAARPNNKSSLRIMRDR